MNLKQNPFTYDAAPALVNQTSHPSSNWVVQFQVNNDLKG